MGLSSDPVLWLRNQTDGTSGLLLRGLPQYLGSRRSIQKTPTKAHWAGVPENILQFQTILREGAEEHGRFRKNFVVKLS